jgi:hypothetical protein
VIEDHPHNAADRSFPPTYLESYPAVPVGWVAESAAERLTCLMSWLIPSVRALVTPLVMKDLIRWVGVDQRVPHGGERRGREALLRHQQPAPVRPGWVDLAAAAAFLLRITRRRTVVTQWLASLTRWK